MSYSNSHLGFLIDTENSGLTEENENEADNSNEYKIMTVDKKINFSFEMVHIFYNEESSIKVAWNSI